MTDETTEVAVDETPVEDNIQISIEQILASILTTLGTVTVELPVLLTDYSAKNIAITQNDETKALTFSITDAPVETEAEAEETAE
jgi:hypothetical protein